MILFNAEFGFFNFIFLFAKCANLYLQIGNNRFIEFIYLQSFDI